MNIKFNDKSSFHIVILSYDQYKEISQKRSQSFWIIFCVILFGKRAGSFYHLLVEVWKNTFSALSTRRILMLKIVLAKRYFAFLSFCTPCNLNHMH